MTVRNVVKLENRRSLRVSRTRRAGEELPGLDAAAVTKIACCECGEPHHLMYPVARPEIWRCGLCEERAYVAVRRRRLVVGFAVKASALVALAVGLAWLLRGQL